MKNLKIARKILALQWTDRLRYPGRLWADTLTLGLRLGLLLWLYHSVFIWRGGEINGLTYPMAAWSMFFYFLFLAWGLRGVSREMARDVRTGHVEILFTKPLSYLLYKMLWQVGGGLYSLLLVASLGVILLVWLVGLPSAMLLPLFAPTFAVAWLGALGLSLVIYGIIGVLAFWLEDINPVFWLVDKAVMILGGSYLPVALFPEFMYKVAIYSPFGANYFISHTVYDTWNQDWPKLLAIQWLWLLFLAVILYFLFKQAHRRLAVNGG